MEKFLWLISHFSCRVATLLIGFIDALWLCMKYENGNLLAYIHKHIPLLISIGAVILILSISMAIIGGKAGYNYAEMGRSKSWNYRNTSFARGDNTFINVMYWAGKFFLLPVIAALFVLLVFASVDIINNI